MSLMYRGQHFLKKQRGTVLPQNIYTKKQGIYIVYINRERDVVYRPWDQNQDWK